MKPLPLVGALSPLAAEYSVDITQLVLAEMEFERKFRELRDWVRATASRQPAGHERSQSPLSPPYGDHPLRVLVACEFSGVVRDAFRARGFNAWSCDLLPSESDPTWHFQEDALRLLSRDPWWDLVIAHPPCTYLTYAGAKHLYLGGRKENGRDQKRWQAMREAAEFFRAFLALPCKVAIENPIMLAAARAIVGRDYSQTIQPWQFGHGEVKRTCLWLKGLPHLVPTNIVDGRDPRVHYAAPGPDRWKLRSRTLIGIAEAMAEQWGDHLLGRDNLPLFGAAA